MGTILRAGPIDAPPLVLLHGWGASKEIWKQVFRSPLTDRYRLIALDFPGTGDVPATESFSPPLIADWVADETARLGLSQFSVLGHSMGGNIASWVASRHPKRVKSLILVSAALYSDRLSIANWYLRPVVGPIALGGTRYLAGLAGWVESHMKPVENTGFGRGYMRRAGFLMINNSVPALQGQLRGMLASPVDIRELPPALPILILHGNKDSTIPVSWAYEAFQSRAQNTCLVTYPDALHCPMDTQTEEFVGEVAAFLDQVHAADEDWSAGSPDRAVAVVAETSPAI